MRKVYDARNAADAHMMMQALGDHGIEAVVMGEFDVHPAPMVWIVNPENDREAMAIVKELTSAPVPHAAVAQAFETSEAPHPEPVGVGRPWRPFLSGLFAGVLLAALGFSVVSRQAALTRTRPTEWDENRDGRIDTWATYEGKSLASLTIDSDFDGQPDAWEYFRDGRLERIERDTLREGKVDTREYFNARGQIEKIERDSDGDGSLDTWETYEDGWIVEVAFDDDRNGLPDQWDTYKNSRRVESRWSYKNDGVIDKKAVYRNGRKIQEMYDLDRDGKFDETVTLDEFERVVRRTRN